MNQRIRTGVGASICILLLILDTKTALNGGAEGLTLCITTVIPSLLPFLFLTALLTSTLTGSRVGILRPVGRIMRMPKGSESLFLTGILGGYPAGAQAVATAYDSGQLPQHEAQRLLGFCSNAGPAFLFGITATQFSDFASPWILWLIHLLSAVITGALLPGGSYSETFIRQSTPITPTSALKKSIYVMAQICGWIVLFRIVIAFLNRWIFWILPEDSLVAFHGLLELTIGCTSLEKIADVGLRFVVCSAMLAFGGICVTMQTASCVGQLGLGLYIPGKLLQCSISIFLALIAQQIIYAQPVRLHVPIYVYPGILALIAAGVRLLQKSEKRYSISNALGV